MKFWIVTAYVDGVDTPVKFLIQSPLDKDKTKKTILEVHPEYKRITLKKTKKPTWVKEWSS